MSNGTDNFGKQSFSFLPVCFPYYIYNIYDLLRSSFKYYVTLEMYRTTDSYRYRMIAVQQIDSKKIVLTFRIPGFGFFFWLLRFSGLPGCVP